MEALIRFYFGVDCRDLDDKQFFRIWADLEFCLIFDGKLSVKKSKKDAKSHLDH